jgi:lysophospholipase L1-like esterase
MTAQVYERDPSGHACVTSVPPREAIRPCPARPAGGTLEVSEEAAMSRSWLRWCVVAVLVLVAACGGSSSPRAHSSVDTPKDTWQLVWFSDSGAWGVASDWAKRIEQAHGVHVEVFDYIGYGGLGSASRLLARVREEDPLRKQIAGAEVVLLYASADDLPLDHDKACLSLSSTVPPRPLTAEVLQPFREQLTAIFDEVVTLRDGRPTLIRSLDLYTPALAGWRKAGTGRACTAGWSAVAAVQREVATAHDVPLVSLYDAFNGPRHDQDPVAKGYIAADGIHTTAEGRSVILSALDATGYDLVAR